MAAIGLQTLALLGLTGGIAVGLLLLVAAVDQWLHRALLPGIIANYRLLPARLVGPAATALPIAEGVTGAALIAGLHPLASLAGIALLLLFAGAMAVNIRRGRGHIDCGCGHGALRHPISWGLVARNLCLAALLALRFVTETTFGAMDIVTAVAGGATLFLLSQLSHSLFALAASPVHRR